MPLHDERQGVPQYSAGEEWQARRLYLVFDVIRYLARATRKLR